MRFQGVLFDAAGTLIAPAEPVGVTYARLACEQGVTLPPARIEDAFRRILAQAPANAYPGATRERAAELERAWWRARVRETFLATDGTARFRDFEGYFTALWEHFARGAAWRAREGAREALAALRAAGLRLAIVSNFDQRLHGILRDLGLRDSFEQIVIPAECGVAKPERAIFEACLARLALAAPQCVYVGDHARLDLEAARLAGLAAVDVAELATLRELPDRLATLSSAVATA
jgi:putative hydrolase of the HAD superfamily